MLMNREIFCKNQVLSHEFGMDVSTSLKASMERKIQKIMHDLFYDHEFNVNSIMLIDFWFRRLYSSDSNLQPARLLSSQFLK